MEEIEKLMQLVSAEDMEEIIYLTEHTHAPLSYSVDEAERIGIAAH